MAISAVDSGYFFDFTLGELSWSRDVTYINFFLGSVATGDISAWTWPTGDLGLLSLSEPALVSATFAAWAAVATYDLF